MWLERHRSEYRKKAYETKRFEGEIQIHIEDSHLEMTWKEMKNS